MAGILLAAGGRAPVAEGFTFLSSGYGDTSITGFDGTGATLIAVCLSAYGLGGGGTPGNVTDSEGNTYLKESNTGPGGSSGEIWVAVGDLNVSASMTITTAGDGRRCSAIAFSGNFDTVQPESSSGTNTGLTPGSLSSAGAAVAVVQYTGYKTPDNTGGISSISDGFTIIDNRQYSGGRFSTSFAYKILASAGTVNPTWSSGDTEYATCMALLN